MGRPKGSKNRARKKSSGVKHERVSLAKKLKERTLVNTLVKSLKKNSPDAYIYIDRDSGAMRHTSSGWDFLISQGERVVFVEAKTVSGVLSDWQKLVAAELERAQSVYCVLKFSADGLSFELSHVGGVHRVASATAEKFFKA